MYKSQKNRDEKVPPYSCGWGGVGAALTYIVMRVLERFLLSLSPSLPPPAVGRREVRLGGKYELLHGRQN